MQWLIDIIMEAIEAKDYTTLAEVLATIQGTRFLAYRHDSTQSVPSGGFHTVELNDIIFDTKSEWWGVVEGIKVKEAGYYQCSFSVGFRPTLGIDKKFFSVLFVQGMFVATAMNHSSHSDYISACGSILIHLNAGDAVWLSCSHNSGFPVNLDYSNELTYLSIERVP